MKFNHILLHLALAVFLISGCAGPSEKFTKENHNKKNFSKDLKLCEEIAEFEIDQQYPTGIGGGGGLLGIFVGNLGFAGVMASKRRATRDECLKQRGYVIKKEPEEKEGEYEFLN